jgi:hypothetical protein
LRDCDYQNVNSIGINEGGDSLFGMLTTVIWETVKQTFLATT